MSGDFFVSGQFDKLEDTRPCLLMVSEGGLLKRFNAAYRVIGGGNGKINIAYAFALHGLHISVTDQLTDGPADRIAGAVVGLDQ